MNQQFVFLAFISIVIGISASSVCYNEFEYQYNVIEKLFTLKNGNEEQDSKIQNLETKLEDSISRIDNTLTEIIRSQGSSGGSTYVRWGRTTCPLGAHKVYDGFAAGSVKSFSGSGANYLCLPRDPIWGTYDDSREEQATIHGVDYMIGGQYHNHEAPCAVCWIPRTTWRMIPARNQCHEGWNLEYQGYLVSSKSDGYRSEYVCLDEHMEAVGGPMNEQGNGAHWYYVEARCGTLPCDPYSYGRELTCAVCSYSPPWVNNTSDA